MGFVRLVFALITAAYAAWNAIVPIKAVCYKYGLYHPSGMELKYLPLINATPVWQWGLLILASLIFLIAAWRLVSQPRAAFGPFVLAALVELVAWGIAKMGKAYNAAFTADELKLDYYIWGAVAVMALIYFLFSRTRKKRVTPTVLG